MKIQVDIEIPNKTIEDIARLAAENAFRVSDYSRDRDGEGAKLVQRLTMKQILETDLTPVINAHVERMLPGLTEGVVQETLTKMIRTKVKDMQKLGTLLPKED